MNMRTVRSRLRAHTAVYAAAPVPRPRGIFATLNAGKNAMKTSTPTHSLSQRVAREVERERHERALNDEARTGLGGSEEFRVKDARASSNSGNLKRSSGR